MSASLVGSEMCIRDSRNPPFRNPHSPWLLVRESPAGWAGSSRRAGVDAVSYTHLTLPTICSV
eukprot:14333542-Alexandrium_andersonii.AAC.1